MTVYPVTRQLFESHPGLNISVYFPFRISKPRVPRHFPAHRHDYLEFSFVTAGEGYQMINGVRYAIRKGTFFFLLPYQIHEIFTTSEQPIKLYNCMFDLDVLFLSSGIGNGLEPLLYGGQDLSPGIDTCEQTYDIFLGLCDELLQEYEQNNMWRIHFIQVKLSELLMRFDRIRRHNKPEFAEQKHHVYTVWNVIRHIHLHYRESLSLTELAEQYNFSPSHLSELFKKHIGMNFLHFLHDTRIRHACSLLITSDMNGMEIAMEVGFGSFRTFSRIFRELKGMTPIQYRKQYREHRE